MKHRNGFWRSHCAVLAETAQTRRGAVLVLATVLLVVLLGFVAITVDVGYIQLTKTQLQAAADSAALAGAQEFSGVDSPEVVRMKAKAAIQQMAALHRNGDKSSVTINNNSDVTFGKVSWNPTSQSYVYQWGEGFTPYNLLKVRAMRTVGNGDHRLPLFFAPVLGSSKADVGAEAIASFQPRDIMVVLDFSSSMNDDSCFGAIGKLGRTYIESNMQTMWTQLGSPVYGNLTFTPKYATLAGRAASGTIPHIDVTFRRTKIDVVSTSALSQVRLQFSNGSTQTFSVTNGSKTGTYQGSGSNANKDITNCWVRSGTNGSLTSGNLGEAFTFSSANIKTALGLTGTYPYPSGSWSDYISKVQASSGGIYDAGYRDMYGYMTWIEYLQINYPGYSQTPDLWKTSEQPVASMKDATKSFVDYVTSLGTPDQIGLAIYTHSNAAGAILEHGLSTNLAQVKTTVGLRQAGHYKSGTNISAGMSVARQEIVAKARPRSYRLMVLMTDGLPNEPTSDSVARAACITEANLAVANKIKILTISLGTGADTSLMQQIADITGGIHFNVPGGSSITAIQTQLDDVFKTIATSRLLKLVSGK